ncbi:MAG: DNA-binding response regulator [Candidatus Zixiibacteriota bacterium]|nr:MAG: DNA-binding response regulator [candidate division Zixibacteria bacterium]
MKSKSRILVVEDERDIAELIVYNLEREGFRVESTISGEEGLRRAQDDHPDLVVLDIMLPEMNGLDVCRALKSNEATKGISIIMLTARDEDIDVVTGLEVGADDYITKPFSPRVLIARIRSVLRRYKEVAETKADFLHLGELMIDRGKRKVTVDGSSIELTHTEFELLFVLASRPGWVFSRTQLIDSLRDGQLVITDRAIDVQVANLRKKLAACGHYIQTVRGAGYRMTETP